MLNHHRNIFIDLISIKFLGDTDRCGQLISMPICSYGHVQSLADYCIKDHTPTPTSLAPKIKIKLV